MVIEIQYLFNYLLFSIKEAGSEGMSADYYKFNQLLALIEAAVSNIFALLEQINMSPGTWFVGIDLTDYFSSLPICNPERFASACQGH